ncbi:MAG: Do family serine endopeptidase [Alphaproteobacteria bacterium]|nr:Do family serine endopeptidase [Alphaproteobacteria bacterium]
MMIRSLSAFGLTLLSVFALAGPAAAQQVPQSREQITLSYAPLVEQVAPAVVNIYATKVVEAARFRSPLFNDPFFQRFFGDNFGGTRRRSENSLGSGVIASQDGLVVTNHHVIADADDIQVILRDRREFQAELILSDERTDLAVLKLKNPQGNLPVVTLGDSDSVSVGDLVLAIGNPFGVGQTVTSGIVSGLARTSVDISDYQSFIQTDAAINPGNSGGALVAMDGKLIGINTAIFSGSGGSHGIGFAIPSNMVAAVLRSAASGETLVRPWLGFSGRAVDWDIAAALGMERPHGVIVEQIRAGGPAAAADLRAGDIVTEVDGKPVEDIKNLRFRAATKGVGETVQLTVIRDGKTLNRSFALIAPPEDPPRDPITIRRNAPFAGAVFINLSPAVTEELGLQRDRDGVMAVEIANGSPAARLGLKPGDILRSVNGFEIETTKDLARVMNDPPSVWRLVIDRNGDRKTVEVR